MIFDVSVIILWLLGAWVNVDEYQFISSQYYRALCLVESLHEYAIHLYDLFLGIFIELDNCFHMLDVAVSLTLDHKAVDLGFEESE